MSIAALSVRAQVLILLVLLLSTALQTGAALADVTASRSGTATEDPLAPARVLSLEDLLSAVADRLVDVRSIELRQAEARAELDHLRSSRAFEVEVEGGYRQEDVDRVEVNGPNQKQGRSVDIRRGLTFSITRPLLGRSIEDRLLVANEEQRLVELHEAEVIARRQGLLEVIGIYLDLAAEQRHRELRERAITLAAEMVRVQKARHERGESLRRDLLAATAELSRREAEAAASERREVGFLAELAERVDGESPVPFQAVELDWSQVVAPPAGADWRGGPTAGPPRQEGWAPTASVWYNLPEIDLTFFYRVDSRDGRFLDETDRERGHTPGVELTLEFPLEIWRAGRSFARQAAARAERKRLALHTLWRQTEGRAREVALAHAEAAARVTAAEAELELREEERRIAQLQAQGLSDSPTRDLELSAIEAELTVIKARIALTAARGELARRYFEWAMISGADPLELASVLNQTSDLAGRLPAANAAGSLD